MVKTELDWLLTAPVRACTPRTGRVRCTRADLQHDSSYRRLRATENPGPLPTRQAGIYPYISGKAGPVLRSALGSAQGEEFTSLHCPRPRSDLSPGASGATRAWYGGRGHVASRCRPAAYRADRLSRIRRPSALLMKRSLPVGPSFRIRVGELGPPPAIRSRRMIKRRSRTLEKCGNVFPTRCSTGVDFHHASGLRSNRSRTIAIRTSVQGARPTNAEPWLELLVHLQAGSSREHQHGGETFAGMDSRATSPG